MITGAHSIIYSTNPEADRAFFRDVLELTNVDVGGGWLIFGLPPAEIAVHPADKNDRHELYLICDDVEAFVSEMKARNIRCGAIKNQGWGLLTELMLPGGGKVGVYQPRHARPASVAPERAAQKRTKAEPTRKPSRKRAARPRRRGKKSARR